MPIRITCCLCHLTTYSFSRPVGQSPSFIYHIDGNTPYIEFNNYASTEPNCLPNVYQIFDSSMNALPAGWTIASTGGGTKQRITLPASVFNDRVTYNIKLKMWCQEDQNGFSHVGLVDDLDITVTCLGALNTMTATGLYPVNAAVDNGGGLVTNT